MEKMLIMKIKIKCVESSVETERSFGLMTDLCEGEKQFKSRSIWVTSLEKARFPKYGLHTSV